MYFRRKMKFNIGVVGLLRIQEPFALRQVHRVTVLVFRRIGLLEAEKILQFLRVPGGQPASLVKRQAVEHNRGAVFMQQTVLDHFKLQFTHAANDLFISAKLGK